MLSYSHSPLSRPRASKISDAKIHIIFLSYLIIKEIYEVESVLFTVLGQKCKKEGNENENQNENENGGCNAGALMKRDLTDFHCFFL